MLTVRQRSTIRTRARSLRGADKRAFMARVTLAFLDGSPRRAESEFGWSRRAVAQGLQERQGGPRPPSRSKRSGRKRIEEQQPELLDAIMNIISEAQGNQVMVPATSQTPVADERVVPMSVTSLREELIAHPAWPQLNVPSRQTLSSLVRRLGFHFEPAHADWHAHSEATLETSTVSSVGEATCARGRGDLKASTAS